MRTPFRWINKVASRIPGLGLGLALSAAVGFVCYTLTANAVEQDAQQRFTSMTRIIQYTINGRLKSYADVLRGTASLFQTSTDLTRDQFHNYVEGLSLTTEFPGIESVNYARHITDGELPAFEDYVREQLAKVKADYPPTFKIVPPGRRPSYTVLTFIEPIADWSNRFGVDLDARPSVARTLAESRDTGLPSTSGALVPLKTTTSGLGMRMPIYRTGMPRDTVEQRRAAYVGSVGIGFSVHRLVYGLLEQLPVKTMRMVITGLSPEERPGGPLGPDRRIVLYDTAAEAAQAEHKINRATGDLFQTSMPVGFSHRGWEVTFSIPKSDMYTEVDVYTPILAGLAGVVSTALLYALFHTLTSSRRRAIGLAEEMTKELRASEGRLQQSNETLRHLAAHAENIKEGERKRIAREIHDDLGQNLLALRIEADMLASRTATRHPRLHARARWTLQHIDATMKSVRAIINDLRPNVLDLGLTAAVDWQISEFRRRTGIECELLDNDRDAAVEDRIATTLFRILQESLTNVSRHARATWVRVELNVDPDWISMTITDNGIGLPRNGRYKPGSFGLVGVEERVKILGGTFTVSSSAESGTSVRVSIPSVSGAARPPPSASVIDGESASAFH
jgi:signal transduction histidine kinase